MNEMIQGRETNKTYQSVRSMATYMAAIEKIMWNHEYYGGMKLSAMINQESVPRTYIISCACAFIVSGFTDYFILVLFVFLVKCRCRDGAGRQQKT
jgi:hypothetical protein